MAVRINTNLASLGAISQLNKTTRTLGDSLARLSSGLRIRNAADDAAGLAISSALSVDSRVLHQAVRNINDSASMLNVAEGALRELSNITIRQRELATQAANGVLTVGERDSIDAEANALTRQFNDIVQSTTFNGKQLLDASLSSFSTQAGYGSNSEISFDLGDQLSREAGTGAFDSYVFQTTAAAQNEAVLGDFNNDGLLDMVTLASGGGMFFAGNGDGNFKTGVSSSVLGISGGTAADFNRDGNLDLVTFGGGYPALVSLGNGDATFKAGVSWNYSGTPAGFAVGDVNGDGRPDIIGGSAVMIIGSNGLIQSAITLGPPDSGNGVSAADLNNDGRLDIVVANTSGAVVSYLGNGNGTFAAAATMSAAFGQRVSTGDFNHDGYEDAAVYRSNSIQLLIGNGDGTFSWGASFGFGASIYDLSTHDYNNDGILDLVGADIGNQRGVLLKGNGDGSFAAAVYLGEAGTAALKFGDFNGDEVLDAALIKPGSKQVGVRLAETETVTTTPVLNLMSANHAREAMSVLDRALTRIEGELGAVGSAQSRLSAAASVIAASRENYLSAYSRIADVDVSSEAALVLRTKILQQADAAILAQANQAPSLALALLGIKK